MVDRGFTETDLRTMFGDAHGLSSGRLPGRWVIQTRFRNKDWEIIVEPETDSQTLVVITAYMV
jgi:hypothetical protein